MADIDEDIELFYDTIMDDDNLSAKEKLKEIDNLYDYIQNCNVEAYDRCQEKISEKFEYCDKCKDWYRKDTYQKETKEYLEEECTNPLTGGYLDDYEYRDIYRTYECHICPKGHVNKGKIIDWRYPAKN